MPHPNFLQNIEFEIQIRRLPNVTFFAQKVNIPSLSMTPPQSSTPNNKFFVEPDELEYGELNVTFAIDEEMKGFEEIFNWMKMSFPESTKQFTDVKNSYYGLTSDISVLLLSSMKNVKFEFAFKNAFPISLSDLNLDTTTTSVDPQNFDVSFRYDYFEFKRLY